jgi:hypothetical protein
MNERREGIRNETSPLGIMAWSCAITDGGAANNDDNGAIMAVTDGTNTGGTPSPTLLNCIYRQTTIGLVK